jgi:hypothetical protein
VHARQVLGVGPRCCARPLRPGQRAAEALLPAERSLHGGAGSSSPRGCAGRQLRGWGHILGCEPAGCSWASAWLWCARLRRRGCRPMLVRGVLPQGAHWALGAARCRVYCEGCCPMGAALCRVCCAAGRGRVHLGAGAAASGGGPPGHCPGLRTRPRGWDGSVQKLGAGPGGCMLALAAWPTREALDRAVHTRPCCGGPASSPHPGARPPSYALLCDTDSCCTAPRALYRLECLEALGLHPTHRHIRTWSVTALTRPVPPHSEPQHDVPYTLDPTRCTPHAVPRRPRVTSLLRPACLRQCGCWPPSMRWPPPPAATAP